MRAVHVISGTGLPLRRSDVDTDQIIPANWLKRIERTGFEKGLFATWRDDRDFVLNDERFAGHPGILETPNGDDGEEDRRNLATLTGLAGVVDASFVATP